MIEIKSKTEDEGEPVDEMADIFGDYTEHPDGTERGETFYVSDKPSNLSKREAGVLSYKDLRQRADEQGTSLHRVRGSYVIGMSPDDVCGETWIEAERLKGKVYYKWS